MREPSEQLQSRQEHDRQALNAALPGAKASVEALLVLLAGEAPYQEMQAACVQALSSVGALWEALSHILE